MSEKDDLTFLHAYELLPSEEYRELKYLSGILNISKAIVSRSLIERHRILVEKLERLINKRG